MSRKRLLLLVRSIITASALISMLLQSVLPFTYAIPAYAQVATVTPTPAPTDTTAPTSAPTDTVTPTSAPTQTPTNTVTPTPTNTTTVAPTPVETTVTPTDVPTVVPTDTTTVAPTPDVQNPTNQPTSANVNSQGPPSNNSNVTPTPTAPTPIVTPVNQTQDTNGVLSSTVLKNVSAPTLDLTSSSSAGSATITTNKADYSPTDTAVISGSGFLPNKAYTLEITSSDAPAVDFTTTVTTDDQGTFTYAYQLDGNYRPNYTVYVKNGDNAVATTTFTDGAANIDQCANGGVGNTPARCANSASDWVNGNVNASKAHWSEGDFVSYRTAITGLTPAAHTLDISYNSVNSGEHAFDYLGSFDTTETTGAANSLHANQNDPCSDIISGCNPSSPTSSFVAPTATLVNCGGSSGTIPSIQAPGSVKIWGPTGTTISNVSYLSQNVVQGGSNCNATVRISFSVGGSGSANTILLAWGGHIAKGPGGNDAWGVGNSATNINGSPYHMSLVALDGSSTGAQDRALSAGAIIPPSTIAIVKTAVGGDSTFGYTTTGGGDLPTSFNIITTSGTGTQSYNSLVPGTYTITETAPTGGWSNTNLVCSVGSSPTGTTATPNLSTRTATIVVPSSGGASVTCTYTNTLAQARLTLVKTITNDNGGSALPTAWTLTAAGNTNLSGITGSSTVKNAVVFPGTYTLGETGGPTGYTNGTYSCIKNSGNPVVGNSITLANNDTATCTVNNNDNSPSLTLIKQVVGGSDAATSWTLTATGASQSPSNLSGTTPVVSGSNFKADTYTLAESNGPTGYTASNWACTNGITVTNSQITLGLGQSTTCTITNTRDQGTIVLNKVWSGTPGQTTLNIGTSANGTNTASVQTGANGAAPLTTGVQTVNTGTYYVSETGGLSNYTSGLVCTDNGNSVIPGANNSVVVNKGDAVICTYTNTRNTGTIEVKKVIDPTTDTGKFNLLIDTVAKATDVSNGGTTGAVTVNTGTHSVGEAQGTSTLLSNYTSTYACTDNGQATVSGSGTSVTGLTVNSGDTVVCTFTNTLKRGTMILQKTMVGGTDTFAFTGSPSGTISTNNGQIVVNNVLPGSYTSTETPKAGWDLTGLTCNDGTSTTPSTANLQAGTATFNVDPGETVTCTFTNTKKGHLQVTKVTNPSLDTTTQFSITASGNGTISGNATQTIVGGQTDDYEVTPGTYSVVEGAVAGWDITGNTCTNKVVTAGATATCTITNTERGSVTVTKYQDNNDNGSFDNGEPVLSGWTINLSSQPGQVTGVNGQASFTNLVPGTYTLGEVLQNGWNQSNVWCANDTIGAVDTSNAHTVHLTAGANLQCYVGNFQNATIHVTKVITDPDGHVATNDATVFPYAVGGSSDNVSLGNGDSHNYSVLPGAHTVSETLNSNYDFKGCDTGAATANGTLVTVTSGQTLNVTCTNQQKKVTINVDKVVVLSDGTTVTNDNHTFTATLNGGNNQSFSQNSPTSYSVNPGTFTVGELTNTNYTGLGCKLSTNAAATNFSLASNQTVTVTCKNQQNPGTISGYKYHADGSTGILGWTVNLYSCASNGANCGANPIATALTDATGFYNFTNLVTGFYQVAEVLNSAYTAVSATFHNVTINPGTVSTSNNFANFKNITITVCKAYDIDGNLNTITDRHLVSGWGMTLFSDGNQVGNPQVTNVDGCYAFTNLGPGHDYSVTEENRSGWTPLTDKTFTYDFGTPVDGVNQSHTFINFQNVSISGHKFNDLNRDQLKEQNEPYLAGWVFDLYKWNGSSFVFVESSLPTDAGGNYSFTNLGPGTYQVREEGQSGWVQTTDNPSNITVNSGSNVTGIDFGNQAQGTVIVTKYLDDNANGTMDSGEQTLSGWDMTLDNTKQTTASNGATTFTGVPVGQHALSETQQTGWNLSNMYCSNDSKNLQSGALTDTTNNHSVNVDSAGQTVYCYVGNFQNAKITVTKVLLDANGNPAQNDNTLFGFTITPSVSQFFQLANQGSTSFSVKPGTYDVSEFSPEPNYSFVSCHADYGNNSVGSPIIGGENVTLGSNDNVTVTCTNKQNPGTVIVTKYNDDNQDGVQDNGEQVLSGWTINLSDNGSFVTGQNGQVTFSGVNPGTHNLSENIQSGWIQTNIMCSSNPINPIPTATPTPTRAPIAFNLAGKAYAMQTLNNSNNLSVPVAPNQTVYCAIGNKNVIPVLSIAKTNNTGGNNKGPGALVLYTITVTATQSAADNVTVTDLLPQGFVYQGGSWTANSNVRGDLKTLGVTTEPTYHSPGTWQLGNMAENEIVTLTLLAAVTNVEPGDYKDVTWAQGQSTGGVNVLALAQPTGFVDTNFVGTDVNVVNDQPITSYNATHSLIQSVLGAELPATGANVFWVDLAISLLILGFSAVMMGAMIRRKYNV